MGKKSISFFLAFLFTISSCVTAFASESVSDYDGRVLISSEEVCVAGTTVVVNSYYDQGFRVRTYKFIDNTITEQQMDLAMETLSSTVSNTDNVSNAESKAEPRLQDPIVHNSKSFSDSDRSSTLIGFELSQSGTFYSGARDGYFYLWVGDESVTRAGYPHPEITPDSITIHQTLTTNGIGVSWSWPPSVSATEKSRTFTLGPYPDVNFMDAEWAKSGASSRSSVKFTLTASSRGDVQIKNKVYALSTSTSFSYHEDV